MKNKKEPIKEMNASEAIYGFAAWLTCRNEVTKFGAKEDAALAAELVDIFCKTNNLTPPREGWEKNLKHPIDK